MSGNNTAATMAAMTTAEKSYILAWLSSMPGKWDLIQEERYSLTFSGLSYSEGKSVLELIDLESDGFRPEPADVYGYISRVVSPQPSAEEAFQEVRAKIDKYGLNARREPGTNVYKEGAPAFSHVLVSAAVDRMGGWAAVCSGAAQYQQGGFRGAYIEAYKGAAKLWAGKVAKAIKSGQRPALLFPEYRPFAAASLEFMANRHLIEAQNASGKELPSPPSRESSIDSPQVVRILGETLALVRSCVEAPKVKRRIVPYDVEYQIEGREAINAELDRIAVIDRERQQERERSGAQEALAL